jgi:MFS family permease
MRPTERWVPSLLAFATLVASSVFGVRPLVTYRALDLGAGSAEIGAIASSFAVLAVIAAIPVGRAVDRFGERRLMGLGAIICSISAFAVPALDSVPLLAAAMATLGLGQMMAVVGSHTLVGRRGPAHLREYRAGLYFSFASLGHVIGPGVAGLLASGTGDVAMTVGFVLSGIAAAAAALATVGLPRGVPPTGLGGLGRAGSVRATISRPGMPPALMTGIAALLAVDLLGTYLPLYGEERGIEPVVIGSMLAVFALFQMISRLGLNRLVLRLGSERVMIGSMALAAGVVPVLILDLEVPGLLFVSAVAGIGLGLTQPMTLAWVARITPSRDRGLAMGIRLGSNRLAQVVVPAVIGVTVGQLGVPAILAVIAAMLGTTAGAVGHFGWFHRPGADAAAVDQVPLPAPD